MSLARYATIATATTHAPAAMATIATIRQNPSFLAGWGRYDGSKAPETRRYDPLRFRLCMWSAIFSDNLRSDKHLPALASRHGKHAHAPMIAEQFKGIID